MASARFDERRLIGQMTMTIRVVRGPFHRRLLPIGLWVMKVGARIAGVGTVLIED